MTTNAGDKEFRQYLLGGLDEDARQEVERRMLTDEDFFDELLCVEEELIDEYLGGGLTEDERRDFEGHFLSTPERQRKLRFAKALGKYVTKNSVSVGAGADEPQTLRASDAAPSWGGRVRAFWGAQGWGLRTGAAFAAAVLLFGAAWLVLRTPAPRTFATINLSPSAVTRGDTARTESIRLPPDADALKVNLTLPGGAAEGSRFRVELEDEGGAVESLKAERQDARTVSLMVPASRLARGRYVLRVFESGTDGAEQRVSGGYRFNIE